MRWFALLGCGLWWLGLGCCPAPESVAPPGDGSLTALSWLVGHWSGSGGDGQGVTEEHWSAARGGAMLGFNRSVASGATTHHEFLMIRQQGNLVFYHAFPSGQAQASFRLVELGPERAVFADPAHDFPQRIIYRREGDTLLAGIEGIDAGEPRASQWRLSRVR